MDIAGRGRGAENAGIENAAVAKCGNKKWQALND